MILQSVKPQTTCVDSSLIDPTAFCFMIYDPVCGCNGITYDNDCLAQVSGGVTSWTLGPCSSTPTITNGMCDNFDSYPSGTPIAQGSSQWNTWGELMSGLTPPFGDDADVVTRRNFERFSH